VLAAVEQHGWALHYVSRELRDNKQIAAIALSTSKDAYHLIDISEFRDDNDVMFSAVCKAGYRLEVASARLRNCQRIVLAAVKSYGMALRYASDELKSNTQRWFELLCFKILTHCATPERLIPKHLEKSSVVEAGTRLGCIIKRTPCRDSLAMYCPSKGPSTFHSKLLVLNELKRT